MTLYVIYAPSAYGKLTHKTTLTIYQTGLRRFEYMTSTQTKSLIPCVEGKIVIKQFT